jgi:hypothetical protein
MPKPLTCRQARKGDEGACTEPRAPNLCHGGHNYQEWHSLSPEGPEAKAFGSNMRDVCFPKCFWSPSNIAKYYGKTNPSMWLEDYQLVCRVGRADNDLFII